MPDKYWISDDVLLNLIFSAFCVKGESIENAPPLYFKEKSSLSNTLIINPISDLRYIFSKRLVQNYTPANFNVQYDDKNQKFIKII